MVICFGEYRQFLQSNTSGPICGLEVGRMVSSVDTISSLGDLAALNRAILASIGRAVIVSDLESRIRFMNPAAEKLTGWEQSDALQKHLTDVFHTVNEESVQPSENLVESVTRGGAVANL